MDCPILGVQASVLPVTEGCYLTATNMMAVAMAKSL